MTSRTLAAGAAYVNPPKRNLVDAEEWETDGKPFEPKLYEPVSKDEKPDQYKRQEAEIQMRNLTLEASVRDTKNIARRASDNQAPPLPLEINFDLIDDSVASSAYPIETYNAAYVRGNMLRYIEEAKKVQEIGENVNRDPDHRYSEEELELMQSEYMYLTGQQPNLPAWDPRMFPPDGTVVLFGRRRSGKSWLIRELIWRYRHLYRQVVVLTNTKNNGFWAKYVPFRFIHKYNAYVIQRVIQHQQSIMAWNELHADEPDKIINPYLALILDDVVAKDLHHDSPLNTVFFEGRHNKIAIFITTQHPKRLPPGVRSNADLAVVFPMWSTNDQETIQEQYCTYFQDKRDFNLMLLRYTQNQQCVVIFLGNPAAPMKQSLYWYKSSEPPPFKTCAQEYWTGDHEARLKYLRAEAGMLTNGDAAGTPVEAGAPHGFQWMVNDPEVDDLISQATF